MMIKTSLASLFLLFCACVANKESQAFTIEKALLFETQAWASVDSMVQSIQVPKISMDTSKTFNVVDYGAKADLEGFDSRPAILQAIHACHAAGGGQVLIPEGTYFSKGPLHLLSHVELHLVEGALLTFSNEPTDYLPLVKVRWEGTVCWNYSPLIYAYQAENIAITGLGTIDGNGREWSIEWRKKQKPDKDRLRQMGNDLVPEDERVFGNGFLDLDGDGKDDGFGEGKAHFLRPTLVELYECERVLLANITVKNSPFWTIHPVFSRHVTIRGVQIYGGYLNDDGIDPDSCEKLLIEDCYIETHDDAISIKAGRDQDAWNRPGSQDIIIRRCRLNSGVNSFCIGSEMSGGVRNIFVEDCDILAGKHGMNFKCNLDRGGEVKDIYLRNLRLDTVQEAIFIFRMDYHGYRGNHFPTQFSKFYASDITCKAVNGTPFKIVGVPDQPIQDIFLHHFTIDHAADESIFEHTENVIMDEIKIKYQTR